MTYLAKAAPSGKPKRFGDEYTAHKKSNIRQSLYLPHNVHTKNLLQSEQQKTSDCAGKALESAVMYPRIVP